MKKIFVPIFMIFILLISYSVLAQGNILIKEMTNDEIKRISLIENPSTGYRWHISIENNDIIHKLAESSKEINKNENVIGSPIIRNWEFVAKKKGVSKINFSLYRTGNKENIKKKKTFIFVVGLPVIKIDNEAGVGIIKLMKSSSNSFNWDSEILDKDIVNLIFEESQPLGISEDDNEENKYTVQKYINIWYFNGLKTGYSLVNFKLYDKSDIEKIKKEKKYVFIVQ